MPTPLLINETGLHLWEVAIKKKEEADKKQFEKNRCILLKRIANGSRPRQTTLHKYGISVDVVLFSNGRHINHALHTTLFLK